MSPKTVIATVRGIGVAVMTSTWGGRMPFSRSASRCSTPKRCCSSTTTSARSANWTCFWIRAWVPTTMPASPEAASSRDAAARRGALAAGEQGHGGAELRAAEHAALGQVAEHRRDRAVVLGRQHLGGGEQGRLAARVDGGQHRPQRDDRLARADLALQQPVHRAVGRELGRQHLADLALARRQLEGQPGVEGREQAARTRRPRRRELGLGGLAALGEDRLEHEGLVVLEPVEAPRRLVVDGRVGGRAPARRHGRRDRAPRVRRRGRARGCGRPCRARCGPACAAAAS